MSGVLRRSLLLAAVIPPLLGVGFASSAGAGPAAPDRPGMGVQGDVAPAPSGRTRPLSDPVLCPIDYLDVPESDGAGVVTGWLHYGESITVEPLANQIWAGVWFTGTNGPEGWPGTSAPGYYPLPGAPEYSLIGRIGNNPYQYVGSADRTFTNTLPGYVQRVRFKVNDNNPANGSGAFRVFIRYPCH